MSQTNWCSEYVKGGKGLTSQVSNVVGWVFWEGVVISIVICFCVGC